MWILESIKHMIVAVEYLLRNLEAHRGFQVQNKIERKICPKHFWANESGFV